MVCLCRRNVLLLSQKVLFILRLEVTDILSDVNGNIHKDGNKKRIELLNYLSTIDEQTLKNFILPTKDEKMTKFHSLILFLAE